MKQQLVWLLVVAFVCLPFTAVLGAGTDTYYVWNGNDNGPNSLRSVIQQITSGVSLATTAIINIDCNVKQIDLTTLGLPSTIILGPFAFPKVLNTALTLVINGNGVTINSKIPNAGFLYLGVLSVTFNDITFTNFYQTPNFMADAIISVLDSAVTTTNFNRVYFKSNYGKLIMANSNNAVTIDSSTFDSNVGLDLLAYLPGFSLVQDSTFYNNSVSRSYQSTSILSIGGYGVSSSTFFQNTGAYILDFSGGTLQNVAIVQSSATYDLYVRSSTSTRYLKSNAFNTKFYETPGTIFSTGNLSPFFGTGGLQPLANNGGPTPTCALSSGGSLREKGEVGSGNIQFDQRGATRVCGLLDIGAVEYIDPADSSCVGPPSPGTCVPQSSSASLSVSASGSVSPSQSKSGSPAGSAAISNSPSLPESPSNSAVASLTSQPSSSMSPPESVTPQSSKTPSVAASAPASKTPSAAASVPASGIVNQPSPSPLICSSISARLKCKSVSTCRWSRIRKKCRTRKIIPF